MGQNTADPAADAHDADLAEEADLAKDAKIEALKKMAERQHRHDMMEERINQIFPTLGSSTKYPTERFDFIMDIGNQLDRLNKKKQSRSDARFMILKAIAFCPYFRVVDSGETDVYAFIELLVPRADEPGWGHVGRPKTLRHRIYRMVEDGLLDATLEGRTTTKLTLTQFGAFYLHSFGHFSGPDLLAHWRWSQDNKDNEDNNTDYINPQEGRPAPVWDNPRYREFVDTGSVDQNEEFHLNTPGATRWESLRRLHDDPWLPQTTGRLEVYDLKLRDLKGAIEWVHEGMIVECFKMLDGSGGGDRYTLMADVLAQSDIKNVTAQEDIIERLDRGSYPSRFTKLCGYFQTAHPDEDANEVIGELILRSAWVIVRQVMDHRMGDDYSSNTIKRADLGDPTAQLDLDEYRMIQGWVDPETDYEPDEDSYGSRAQTR
jgi:hypothetical protein